MTDELTTIYGPTTVRDGVMLVYNSIAQE